MNRAKLVFLKSVCKSFYDRRLNKMIYEHENYIENYLQKLSENNNDELPERKVTDLEEFLSICGPNHKLLDSISKINARYILLDKYAPKEIKNNITIISYVMMNRNLHVFNHEQIENLQLSDSQLKSLYKKIVAHIKSGLKIYSYKQILYFLIYDESFVLLDRLLEDKFYLKHYNTFAAKLYLLNDKQTERIIDRMIHDKYFGIIESFFEKSKKYRMYIYRNFLNGYDLENIFHMIPEDEMEEFGKILVSRFKEERGYELLPFSKSVFSRLPVNVIHYILNDEILSTRFRLELKSVDTSKLSTEDLWKLFTNGNHLDKNMLSSIEFIKMYLNKRHLLPPECSADLINEELLLFINENRYESALLNMSATRASKETLNEFLDFIIKYNDIIRSDNFIYNLLNKFPGSLATGDSEIIQKLLVIIEQRPNIIKSSIPLIKFNKELLYMLATLGKIDTIETIGFNIRFDENDKHIIAALYNNLDFNQFLKLIDITEKGIVLKSIELQDINEFEKRFKSLLQPGNFSIANGLILICKYNLLNHSEHTAELDELCKKITNQCREIMVKQYKDLMTVNLYIDGILSGKLNPLYLSVNSDLSSLKVTISIGELRSRRAEERIKCINSVIIDKINKKHLRQVFKSLVKMTDIKSIYTDDLIDAAIKMYLSLGFSRAMELLSPTPGKNYGSNCHKTLDLFRNIDVNNISFEPDGAGFKPKLNEEWVKLIFGDSYKIPNTPIKNFLNDCSDYIEEMQFEKKKIEANSELTPEEKEAAYERIDLQICEYKKSLELFMEKIASDLFNRWDIYFEEFLKSESKSKLLQRFNLQKVIEISKIIKMLDYKLELSYLDMPLINSDVFEYVGYDTQFTRNIETVRERAVTLSRRMDSVVSKKFPEISITKGKYTIKVMGAQDRRLISAGYRSGCCFRPNGNADDSGNDNSLLDYCVSTEYGGGLEILDDKGNTIVFSPLLRNGNVLMIHSIETRDASLVTEEIGDLICDFSNEIIKRSHEEGDEIDFVLVTTLHNTANIKVKGSVPKEKMFKIHGDKGMYNNLSLSQLVIASRDNKTVDDIQYYPVEKSYDFNVEKFEIKYLDFSSAEIEMINTLSEIKNKISEKMEHRKTLKTMKDQNQAMESYQVLEEINTLKKLYLEKYKEMIKIGNGRNVLEDYRKVTNFVSFINKELKMEMESKIIVHAVLGNSWYIILDSSNNIFANALETGKEELKEALHGLLQLRNIPIENVEGNISRT